MKPLSTGLKKVVGFTAVTMVLSIAYYLYARSLYPPTPERETFLTEVGEGIGEIALWGLIFIYARTAIKLLLGKGALAKRILPDYSLPVDAKPLQGLIRYLDRTHVYVGIATVVVSVLHIALMGLPMHILFFPAVLALVLWQGLFGMFITWRYTPKELKKLSYLVHAQLFTGIMMGIFAYLGHLFIDN